MIFEKELYILKANYSLAVNSIEAKKKERLDNTLDAYYDYENYQPTLSGLGEDQVSKGAQSKFAKEAENIHGNTLKGIENLTKQLN